MKTAHQLIRKLAINILSQGGGLVVQIGDDPRHEDDPTIPLIFDWTVLEALDTCHKENKITWPESQGVPVIVVGLPKWKNKIPVVRKRLWSRLLSQPILTIKQVQSELGVGGILREVQSQYGNILVTLGGGPGVNHLADLYMNMKKPVIPLDLPLKKGKLSASEELHRKVFEDPTIFFECESKYDTTRLFSRLSFDSKKSTDENADRVIELLSALKKPTAFYVRLMNTESSDFLEVEDFFRNVVDEVVETSGYQRFESGLDPSHEAFLNEEIFQNLHYSALAIVDLTGIRSNCCIEFGYALGQKKKFILMAKKCTKLPFDTKMISCHFWSTTKNNDDRQKELLEYMEKNIDRRPVVP